MALKMYNFYIQYSLVEDIEKGKVCVRRNYWSVGDTHFHKNLRFTCWENMRVLESHPEHVFFFFFSAPV